MRLVGEARRSPALRIAPGDRCVIPWTSTTPRPAATGPEMTGISISPKRWLDSMSSAGKLCQSRGLPPQGLIRGLMFSARPSAVLLSATGRDSP